MGYVSVVHGRHFRSLITFHYENCMGELTPLRAEVPDETPETTGRNVALGVEAILELLRLGTLELQRELPWSSNYTFMGTVNREDMTAKVVYKPKQGESPLWDFPTGTLYKREEAAFLVSDALGWNLVPPTVSRKGDFGVGMVQFFIEHDPEEHFFTFREPWDEQLTRLVLFDVIINNADRKGGHVLRDPNGKLWAIDHGVTFHDEYKLRTVIWELAGEPIPQPYLDTLTAFQACIAKGTPLAERLVRLLSPQELGMVRQRVKILLESQTFPFPRPGRPHVPWPLI
jgi:uncharacterized repeat protein (TIGR03843 family)